MKGNNVDYDKEEAACNIMLTIGIITFIIMMLGVLLK